MTRSHLAPIRASARASSATRAEVRARQHAITIDEPPMRDGTDEGMTPLEVLMASLAGCTNVIAGRIADELGIRLDDFNVEIRALLDNRAIRGQARLETPFPRIDIKFHLKTPASSEQIDQLREGLHWRCPVLATFRASGSTIREEWNVTYRERS